MGIQTKDEKAKLFLGVNEDKKGDGVFFSFPTSLETKARDMITYFGAYLAHTHTTSVLTYLKPEAAIRAKTITWDPVKHEAISKDNKDLDLLMDETEKIDWLQDPNKSR